MYQLRITFALCACILLLTLCACGGGGSDAPEAQAPVTSSDPQAPAQLHAPVLASINPQLPPPVVASK